MKCFLARRNDSIQVDYDDDDFELFVHLLYTGENLPGDFDADLVWRWCCKGGLRRNGTRDDVGQHVVISIDGKVFKKMKKLEVNPTR